MYLCYKKKITVQSTTRVLVPHPAPENQARPAPASGSTDIFVPPSKHAAPSHHEKRVRSQTNRSRGERSPSPSVLAPAGRKRMADGDGSPPLVPRSPGGGTGAGHTTPPTPDASSACLLLRLRPSLSSSTRAARPRNRIQSPAVHSGAVPNRGRAEGALWFLERRSNPPSDATSDSARLRVTAREQEQPQMTPF